MIRQHWRRGVFCGLAFLSIVAGCGRPELTKEELGTVHYTIPKLKGDDVHISFPKPRATVSAVQSTGETLPVIEPTGANPHADAIPLNRNAEALIPKPVVQPTGTSLPPSQPGTLPAAQGTSATTSK